MPPRHAYWTILVDDQPTAFRAHDAEELLPTLNRLKEKNPSAVMKWFERGKLYESRDTARDSGGGEGERRWEGPRPDRDDRGETADQTAPHAGGDREGPRREGDRRDRNWRPGGEHKDPRQKYKDASKAKWDRFKKNIRDRSERGRAAAAGAPEGAPGPARANGWSNESMDPETFSPPHGDPLREHIDEQVEETPGFEPGPGEPSEDPARPEPSRGDGAPSRPHGDPVRQPVRRGSEESGGNAGGAQWRQDDTRGRGENRERPGASPREESRGEWRERPRDNRGSGGRPGYEGKKPWGGGGGGAGSSERARKPWGGDRDRASGGGWRPQGPPSGDRASSGRPPRDREGGGNPDWRDRPRDDRGGSGGRPGYEGRKPWGGGGGYQGSRPWGGENRDGGFERDRNRRSGGPSQPRATSDGGESRGAPPHREGGWRPLGPPSGDRPYGDRPPRAKWDARESSGPPRDRQGGGGADWRDRPREDRGGSSARPGYEGKKPWSGPPRATREGSERGGGAGPSDRARKPWGPKPGGGKPWGAGPGNRPGGAKPWGSNPDGSRPSGGKPWGSKPGGSRPQSGGKPFGPRGPRKRRDDE